jgi:serine protease Do
MNVKNLGYTLTVFTAGIILAKTQSALPPVSPEAHAALSQSNSAPLTAPELPADTFVRLAKSSVPSVVNISTVTHFKRADYEAGEQEMLEHFFGGMPGGMGGGMRMMPMPGQTPALKRAALGTGFIIDSSGIILTNNHVVEGADEIKIQFAEGEEPVIGKVIGRDPELDVALIRVKTNRKLEALKLGDSDALDVGEYVMAVGNPYGQGHSVSHGIVSAKGRIAPGLPIANYLQIDAPINPGNSGGPLLNMRGEVIGINNAIDPRAQGIGFAIPINFVKNVLPDLESGKRIERGFIRKICKRLSSPKWLKTARLLARASSLMTLCFRLIPKKSKPLPN